MRILAWTAVAVVLVAGVAEAQHQVGQTVVVFRSGGAVLRKTGTTTGAAVATLPVNTYVVVEEVKGAWIRVRAGAQGQPAQSGWIRGVEAIAAGQLTGNAQPAHLTGAAGGHVNAADAAAAGRQFTEETERGYAARNRDLGHAYAAVAAMENETAQMPPAEAIAFILDGGLGRQGVDYHRPARLPPTPPRAQRPRGGSGQRGGGGLGGLLRGARDAARGLGVDLSNVPPALQDLAFDALDLLGEMRSGFTPDQEYYLGRAVAAQAIAKYGLDPDPRRRRYVKLVGEAIVRLSKRFSPNYGGYHFEVLNSDEINGISGPGGFVLITRGAVEACRDENELAGILGHELTHVNERHGLQMVQASQQHQQRMRLAESGLKALKSQAGIAGQFVDLFSGMVDQLTTQALSHNYGPAFEQRSDVFGAYLLFDAYYDWNALERFLRREAEHGHVHGGGAHSDPTARANFIAQHLGSWPKFELHERTTAYRLARFERAIGRTPSVTPR